MRPFEILTCLLAIPPISILLWWPAPRRALLLSCLLLSLSLAIQISYEGAHWQLIPLYLACVFLLLSEIAQRRLPRWASVVTAAAGILLVGSSVVFSWLMPMFKLPKPSGQYAVGTRIFHLVDISRNEESGPSPSGKRELIVQAWYPTNRPSFSAGRRAAYQRRKEVTLRASYRSVLKTNSYLDTPIRSGGPYPVLIYNPGWMGERTEGTYQMEELASHGFIVIAVDHTFYGGLVEFPDGRVTDSHTVPQIGNFEHSSIEEQWALGSKYVRIEAQDDIFVLDQLQAMDQNPSSPWFHQLDMSRVGVMGFSIGGAAAIQMASQDPRVKAALNMDGWIFGDFAQHPLAKPLMIIYEDKRQVLPTPAQLNAAYPPERMQWQFAVEDFAHVTASMNQYGGFLVFLAGTRHVDFTDRSLFSPLRSWTGGGKLDPTRTHAIVNAYTLAFFSHFLNGTKEPLLETNPPPYSEVESQHFELRTTTAAEIP